MYFNIKQLEIILKLLVKCNINKAKRSWRAASKTEVNYKVTPNMKRKETTGCQNNKHEALENIW